ncbi:hypothetical protein JUJ52_19730 [Virgibacillus sp. AGTR]|uniref:hypothetical protein n=1 Tax=Virgibacillus sp. AGTR TaxID=2812055 RepID=UPI001D1694C8|nr:hypothetical protein [Virgibacillus sp. AGTR]MCC2252164.1 hypothetical protein [Virgibacillus sp. AGTR]
MLTTERHILKSLQHVTSELPDLINKKDSHFVIEATNAVITALLDAEEPINKTHRYHERAKHITEDLQTFIQYRARNNGVPIQRIPTNLTESQRKDPKKHNHYEQQH